MFAVDDIDDVVARLQAHGAELVGEVAQYEDTYRLCYLRGPEGIIVALAEELTLSWSTLSRRCSSSCAASSTALFSYSAARYSNAMSPVRWMRRTSSYTVMRSDPSSCRWRHLVRPRRHLARLIAVVGLENSGSRRRAWLGLRTQSERSTPPASISLRACADARSSTVYWAYANEVTGGHRPDRDNL